MSHEKAPKPSGYTMFVEDLQKQHPEKYSKLKDAFDSAPPLSARMSPEQRKPYGERAQRFTSQGVDLQTLDSETHLLRNQTTEPEVVQQIMTTASQSKCINMIHEKAPNPNPYTMFVENMRKNSPEKYRMLKDAVDSAPPLSARMSPEERKPYRERAQRFTSQGVDLQTLDSETQLLRNQPTEREVIQQITTTASQSKCINMSHQKAPKPSPYPMFKEDLQKQHPEKYSKLKDAFDSAPPLLARMSPEQRKPYRERAQRFPSQGVDLQTLDSETQLLRNQTAEREVIQQIMTTASQSKSLATETFFIIQCNIFCYTNMNGYYGAEIAVICFNLRDGVKPENILHFMVIPGPLPVGYRFEAQQHSDNTHLIPIPKDKTENGEVNTQEIYFKLKAFLEKKNPEGHRNMPILYASNRNVKVVKDILADWKTCYEDEDQTFRVYEIQRMFLELRNAVAGEKVWTSITSSVRELEKDVYDYMAEIACSYHAVTPKPMYCSKSVVTRYVYIICGNCIADLEIEFIYGQHVPKGSTIPQDKVADWSAGDSVAGAGASTRNFDTSDKREKSSVRSTLNAASHFDDGLPSLGQKYRRAGNTSEANISVASSGSYAGVTTINTPQSFLRDMSHSSIQPGPTLGRGRRRENNPGASSVILAQSFSRDMSHLSIQPGPTIGRGRGRGFRRRENNPGVSSVILEGFDRIMVKGKGRGFTPKNIPRPGD